MATQGMVTVIDDQGEVKMKVVAGCDGYSAPLLAKLMRQRGPMTYEEVRKACMDVGFGCHDCLVIYSSPEEGKERDENNMKMTRYEDGFGKIAFNPRWESGITEYLEVVTWREKDEGK